MDRSGDTKPGLFLEILKQLRGGGESVVYKLKQFYTF
jgi:hypothetical protein